MRRRCRKCCGCGRTDGRQPRDRKTSRTLCRRHQAAGEGGGDEAGQGGRAVAVNGQRNREARRPSGLTRAPPITDEEIPMRMTPVTTLRKTALLPALIATGLFAGCGGAAESAADAAAPMGGNAVEAAAARESVAAAAEDRKSTRLNSSH